MQITVTAKDEQVQQMLQQLSGRMRHLTPVMKEIGEIVRTSIEQNFAETGRPEKWPESQRVKRKGGQTLSDKGRLRRSFTVQAESDRVSVGTNVIYAAIHQFGGKTSPHVITAKRGKALFWVGARHPVKSVNHPGSKIPARPFLMVQDADWTGINSAVNRYLLER